MFRLSGAPSARSMWESIALHVLVLLLLLLVPAQVLLRSEPDKNDVDRELDIVFHRPPVNAIDAPAAPQPARPATPGFRPGAPAPALKPIPDAPDGPDGPGDPELPSGPEQGFAQAREERVGRSGILAFKDQFASLAQDKTAPRLGAEARYGVADETGRPSSRSSLATNTQGSSGGINVASLNRNVGGGGGGGGRGGTGGGGRGGSGTGGTGGGGGMAVARASSPIAAIAGDDRPLSRNGVGPARTDEEIQIVFDRYKSAFYRLYNRELRNNPTLKGQMVLRLTIEPDGSVSMCVLQSSDMNAPDLATQVVNRVLTINFGAKAGVPALTIVYPIDFLPAA